MNTTLQIMKQELEEYLDLKTYPDNFKEMLRKNKIDRMLFIDYLENNSIKSKNFTSYLSIMKKNFIEKLYIANACAREPLQIKYEKGFIKIRTVVPTIKIRNHQLEFFFKEFSELIEATNSNYKSYFNSIEEDERARTATIFIALQDNSKF